jgi:hypothetical protein
MPRPPRFGTGTGVESPAFGSSPRIGTGSLAPGGSGASSSSSPNDQTQTGAGTAGVGNLLPWLYPTADFVNFDKGPKDSGLPTATGAVALPAIGTTATVLKFRVDNGRMGKITQMGIDFVANGGAVYVQGIIPAQLSFSLQADGKTSFRDYEQFQFLPGAVSAPTPINGLMLRDGQVITLLVTNLAVVVTTQFISARLLGYTFSKKLWPKIMGLQ